MISGKAGWSMQGGRSIDLARGACRKDATQSVLRFFAECSNRCLECVNPRKMQGLGSRRADRIIAMVDSGAAVLQGDGLVRSSIELHTVGIQSRIYVEDVAAIVRNRRT